MAEYCSCLVCGRRSAEGLARLPGVSVMREMHVTATDLGGARRPAKQKPAVVAQPERFTQGELLEGVAGALALVREEYEGLVAALEARIAMLESRTSPDELAQRIGTQTRQLLQRLTAERPRDGHHRTH